MAHLNTIKVLLDAPLVDVGAEGGGYSVPTSINADHMHFASLRLDYCLVNEELLQPCSKDRRRVRARLVRDERTDVLSDHYPLEASFYTA